MIEKFYFKYSLFLIFAFLFLSCEEIAVDDLLSEFSDDNVPVTTINTVDSLYQSSSVSLNWVGNDYATSYSYRLEPLSYEDTVQTYINWSDWDTVNAVTFTNLDEGNYTFYIKSRFTVENEEEAQSIFFSVDAIEGSALRVYPKYRQVSTGETFNIYVYIEDVVDLVGTELHLSYPLSYVSANSVIPGEILSNSYVFFDTINSAEGTLELVSSVNDSVGFTGTGTLSRITFTAGDSPSIDTLFINETSILRTSSNESIDITDMIFGVIEVVE